MPIRTGENAKQGFPDQTLRLGMICLRRGNLNDGGLQVGDGGRADARKQVLHSAESVAEPPVC